MQMNSWLWTALAATVLLAASADALFFDFLPATRRGRANVNHLRDDDNEQPMRMTANLKSPPLRAAEDSDADTDVLRSLIEAVMGAAADEPVQSQQAASFLELPVEEPLLQVILTLLIVLT